MSQIVTTALENERVKLIRAAANRIGELSANITRGTATQYYTDQYIAKVREALMTYESVENEISTARSKLAQADVPPEQLIRG